MARNSFYLKHYLRSLVSAVLVLAAAAICLGLSSARAASILHDLGYDDQHWALYSLNGTLNIQKAQVNGTVGAGEKSNIDILNGSTVTGNVYAYSKMGQLNVEVDSSVLGQVFSDDYKTIEIRDNSSIFGPLPPSGVKDSLVVAVKRNSYVGGLVDTSGTNAELNSKKAKAISASNQATAMTATTSVPGNKVDLKSGSGMVSGGLGQTIVLKLTDFKLNYNSTFTLNGTSTTKFVLNVTRSFEIKGNSHLVLSGGLLAENVLFNLIGTGSSLIESSTFSGIILGVNRDVKVTKNSELAAAEIVDRIYRKQHLGGQQSLTLISGFDRRSSPVAHVVDRSERCHQDRFHGAAAAAAVVFTFGARLAAPWAGSGAC